MMYDAQQKLQQRLQDFIIDVLQRYKDDVECKRLWDGIEEEAADMIMDEFADALGDTRDGSNVSERIIYRIWYHTASDRPVVLAELDVEDKARDTYNNVMVSLPDAHLELERTELVEHDSWLILSHNAPEAETPPK